MTKQIAVKLPDRLIEAVDHLVATGTFASRSHVVRRGLEAVVANERRLETDHRFRTAAARFPETEEEIKEATRLAIDAINEEPWEPWW